MVVTVVLWGLPQYVTLQNLARSLDQLFATDSIKSFHVRDLPNHPTTNKRRVALDFKSGYDGAMDAQSILDGYKYTLDNGAEYTLSAKVTHDPTLQRQELVELDYRERPLVEYDPLSSLNMHLKSVLTEREIIKNQRKLLREKKKLLKEKTKMTSGDSDTETGSCKKRKHCSNKKKKDKRKRRVSASSDNSKYESRRSKSPSPSTTASGRKSAGMALVPYKAAYKRLPSSGSDIRSRSKSPRSARSRSPPRGRSSDSSSSSPKEVVTRQSLKLRPSRKSPSPRRRSSPSPSPRRQSSPSSRRRSLPSPCRRLPIRGPRSPSSPPPKRSRHSSSSGRHSPNRGDRGYRRSPPSPSPSTSYRRRSPSRKRHPPYKSYDRETIYLDRRNMASTSRGGSVGFAKEINEAYDIIESLLKSEHDESKTEHATTEPEDSSALPINITLNIVKNKSNEDPKKHKKTPKTEPEEGVKYITEAIEPSNYVGVIPKPFSIDPKSLNLKSERNSSDLEDGEICEIKSDDEGSDKETAPKLAWEPVTPAATQKPFVKQVSKNPRFVMPLCKIVSTMKKHFRDIDKIKKYRLIAILKDVMAGRLKEMLKNEGYKCTREIVAMYREHYPMDGDEKLVNKTLKNIDDGVYDVFVGDDNTVTRIKQEKDDNGKENKKPAETSENQSAGSGQWVPFKQTMELDDDILILEEEKPTLDLTAGKEPKSDSSDRTIVLDLDPGREIFDLKQELDNFETIDDPYGLEVTVKSEQGESTACGDADMLTVQRDGQNDNAERPPPKEVQPRTVDPVAMKINDKTIREQIDAATAVIEESSTNTADASAPADEIKAEFVETVDDIAKFVQEAEVVKDIIDLTDD